MHRLDQKMNREQIRTLRKYLKRHVKQDTQILKLAQQVDPDNVHIKRRLEVTTAEVFLQITRHF